MPFFLFGQHQVKTEFRDGEEENEIASVSCSVNFIRLHFQTTLNRRLTQRQQRSKTSKINKQRKTRKKKKHT